MEISIKEQFKEYLSNCVLSKESNYATSNLGSTAVYSYMLFIEPDKLFDYAPEQWQDISSIYDITSSQEVLSIIEKLFKDEAFVERDTKNNRYFRSNGIKQYYSFLKSREFYNNSDSVLVLNNSLDKDQPLQQIFYGAPGTGKSYKINEITEKQPKGNVFRTTFHPDSDYSTFVGCYKPTTEDILSIHELSELYPKFKAKVKNRPVHRFILRYSSSFGLLSKDEAESVFEKLETTNTVKQEVPKMLTAITEKPTTSITYSFVPQAFTKAYIRAWQTEEPVYLIIEEINRGNCAQIFGDLFQLLDRKNGESEYPIKADNDLATYLKSELGEGSKGIANGELKLPSNLYIWATMNTSDQSLFPIDSAFKRRWDWQYIKITEGNDKQTKQPLGWKILVDDEEQDDVRLYDWWTFLQIINKKIYAATGSADKQMGYFFAKAKEQFSGVKIGVLNNNCKFEGRDKANVKADIITAETFVNKVLFYLWTDVMKDNEYEEITALMKTKDNEEMTFPDFFGNTSDEVNQASARIFLDNVIKEKNDYICDVAERIITKDTSSSDGNEWFKPQSVIFKITKYPEDRKELYDRARGRWLISKERAEATKYFYAYATPVKTIVACYKVESFQAELDNKGKTRYRFVGTEVENDPMIGKPVEKIAHARGGVVFYTDNFQLEKP